MNSLYPVLCSDDVAVARDFYVGLLGLRVVFEADWYVQLQSPTNERLQLGIVQRGHASVPAEARQRPGGIFVTIEVDDVDAVHRHAEALGLDMAYALRDEPWGQRHFMVADPEGLLVDIVTMIPPATNFAEAGEPV